MEKGFLGNLTVEEESKLFQLWDLVLIRLNNEESVPDSIPNTSTAASSIKSSLAARFRKQDSQGSPESGGSTLLFPELWNAIGHEDLDGLLLRFLRARKWDVEAAYEMLAACLKWRVEFGVTKLVMRGETESIQQQFATGKSFAFNVDKNNQLICYNRVKFHDKNAQPLQESELFTIYVMESCRKLLTRSVQRVTVVFDLTDFTMASMDYMNLKFLVNCFQNYYPESLGKCLIVNAPWIFEGCWAIIKQFLDPVVKSKVCFLKSYQELTTFIDADKLPEYFGGSNSYVYEYVPPSESDKPLENDELLNSLTERFQNIQIEITELTKKIIRNDESDDKAQIASRRNQLKMELSDVILDLEQFEPKSYYHRVGIVRENQVVWPE
jgi:hypothetical protein